jgi:TolB protein
MSGDGRIDVSPDGKRLLLSIDTGEESGRKDWDGTVARALGVRSPISKGDQADAKKTVWLGWGFGSTTTIFSFSAELLAKRMTRFIACPLAEKI